MMFLHHLQLQREVFLTAKRQELYVSISTTPPNFNHMISKQIIAFSINVFWDSHAKRVC